MSNQRVIYILLGATIMLLIGTSIYYCFRMPIMAFDIFHIYPKGLLGYNTDNPIIYFFAFCLPDALWYMSLLQIQSLFFEERGWLNRLLVDTAISLPFLLEMGQFFGFISGTFDWWDILTYCITLIVFLCLRKTSLLQPSK